MFSHKNCLHTTQEDADALDLAATAASPLQSLSGQREASFRLSVALGMRAPGRSGDLQTLLQPVVVLHDVSGFGAARGPQDQGEVDTQQVPHTGSVTTPA